MGTVEYCDFSDLPADSCGHCRSNSRVLPDTIFQANEDGGHAPRAWVAAQWPGRCVKCAGKIEPGDLIGAVDGGWSCEGCAL